MNLFSIKPKRVLFVIVCILSLLVLCQSAYSQVAAPPKLGIKSFAIFGGDAVAIHTDSVNYGVEMASNISVQGGGSIGSNAYVQFNNQVGITGDIYANVFTSGNSTSVKGNISVLNVDGYNFNVLRMASLADISAPGNIYVNGNSSILGGTVAGKVQHEYFYTYTGPTPGGGVDTSSPAFPLLPDMPFTNYEFQLGATDITYTQTIAPGRYNVLGLSGGETVTFSGVGNYYFKSIGNAAANNFVFDFKNFTTGAINLFIQDSANVGNINVTIINGGNASRIYTEVQGSGNPTDRAAFSMNTYNSTSSNWEGTIWAPNGAIAIGQKVTGTANVVNGCLWSGTKVKIGINTSINFVPPVNSAVPYPYAGILPYYPPPANGKTSTLIGSELTSLYENSAVIGNDSIIYRVFGPKVLIEVIALQGKYAATLAFLQANGLTDLVNNGPGTLIITGKFPIANLLILNTRTDLIDYVRPLFWPIRNSGIIQTQGDTAMESHFVRGGYGLSGNGVKVGVMSDSYNTVPGDNAGINVINGDLPGPGNPYNHLTAVQVVGEYPYGESIDEGRAMLQIVHDVAPDASLAFRTGFISAGDFAQGISQLKTAGCKVIVDDITFITEPYYTDGVIAKAVNQVVTNGASYFSAAGNFGKKSYQSTFAGMPAPASLTTLTGQVHDFGSGNPFQTLNLDPGNYTIVLQWDEDIYSLGAASSGTQTDLDIYLVDNFGSTLFGFNRNNIGTDPLEVLPFTVTFPTTARLLITKASGASNPHFKYIVFRGKLTSISGYPDGASTIVGQANADSAIAVGAVLYSNTQPYGVTPTVASFSSRGGTTTKDGSSPIGTIRNKPDLSAPNGVNTTVDFLSYDLEGDQFPNFYGTSAAAPHAAAAAALLIQGQQKYLGHVITPHEIRNLLIATATDMGPVLSADKYDTSSGYGFIQPFAAMQTFASPKPEITSLETPSPIISPVSSPFTVTVKGKFLTSQTKVYFGTTELATTFTNSEEVSAEIPSFSGDPAVRLYNPPISSSSLDGGFSDSYYFSSPVKKHIIVKAENKEMIYGEFLPAFTSIITLDNVAVTDNSTLTDLKLTNLTYFSPASSSSNVALYYIQPKPSAPLNADDPLLKKYTYEFVNGVLKIGKLPLTITPKEITLTYGARIHNIAFDYNLNAAPNLADSFGLKSSIGTLHAAGIADSIFALLNGSGATSRALVNTDLEDLGILISNGSGATSRALVNNGSGTTETSYVVNVDTSSIVNYVDYYYESPTIGNGSGATSRALVNSGPLVNGTASIRLENGSGATSRALVNGDPSLTNSTPVGGGRTNVAVVVSVADLDSAAIRTKSVNMVTGITAGIHTIVPAAFRSGNFIITYAPGKLNINKASLNVTANTAYTNNGVLPPFTSIINYQYQDASLRVSGPLYTLNPLATNPAKAGVYDIIPAGLVFSDYSNYNVPFNYIAGKLYVNPYGSSAKKVTIVLKCVEVLPNTLSGFKYIAHFSYNNSNATPVYVPIGVDNKITSVAAYSGIQPTIFKPGVNYVDYYFNGQKLTWAIRTNEGVSKKTVSEVTAISSSTKCKALSESSINTLIDLDIDAVASDKLYPNPATNTLWILSNDFTNKQKNITIMSTTGVMYQPKIKIHNGGAIEIDISALQKGVYFIRMKEKDKIKTLSFIKL